MNLMNIPIYTGDSQTIALPFNNLPWKSDPRLAYVAIMSSLSRLLEKSYGEASSIDSLGSSNYMHLLSTDRAVTAKPEPINKSLERNINNIKDKFDDIKKIIDALQEKGDFFMKLRSKKGNNAHYIIGEEWQEFEDKFVFSTKRIIDTVKLIRESIKNLRAILSQNSNYPSLDQIEKCCKNLLDKIPDPSSKWKANLAEYDGSFWMHKSINGEEKTVFYEWDKWFKDIKNPVGLLEMVLDTNTQKKKDFLATIGNGADSTEEFVAKIGEYTRKLRREEVFKHLKSLGTEDAYIYLITTVLPMLQDQSSATLEEEGNSMQLISTIYEKWNSIQKLINESMKKQSDKGNIAADELGNKIKAIVLDIQYQLKRARIYLHPSVHTLLDTMKDLSNKLVKEYPKDFFAIARDSDQTAFKTYIDNLGQGITALTSVSNMTQQQLQINTQYYNSLLGFQKSSQDSINKIIQASLNNMRSG